MWASKDHSESKESGPSPSVCKCAAQADGSFIQQGHHSKGTVNKNRPVPGACLCPVMEGVQQPSLFIAFSRVSITASNTKQCSVNSQSPFHSSFSNTFWEVREKLNSKVQECKLHSIFLSSSSYSFSCSPLIPPPSSSLTLQLPIHYPVL